jgi:hypothetical protein
VAPEATLSEQHTVIQAAMGWEHFHLWRFGTTFYMDGRHLADDWWERFVDDELGREGGVEGVSLETIGFKTGDRFGYLYDLGDEWVHDVRVEARPERKAGRRHPWVIHGRGACPPEDCGGPGIYPVLVRLALGKGPVEGPLRGYGISRKRAREELGIVRSWRSFDPASFDPREANETLERWFA